MPKFSEVRAIKVRDKLTETMGRVVERNGTINHRALAKLARVPLSNVVLFRDSLGGFVDSGHLVFISKGERVASDAVTESLAKELMAEDLTEDLVSDLSERSREDVIATIQVAVEKSWRNQTTRRVAEDAADLSENHATTAMALDAMTEQYENQKALCERKDGQIAKLEREVEKRDERLDRLELLAGAVIQSGSGIIQPRQ